MYSKNRKPSPAGNGPQANNSSAGGPVVKRTQQKAPTPTKITAKKSPIILISNEASRYVFCFCFYDVKKKLYF